MRGVVIFSPVNIDFFIVFPSKTKSFTFFGSPCFLIKAFETVSIWRWFLSCISESDDGNGAFFAFSEGTGDRTLGCWYFRLDDIEMRSPMAIESLAFGKGVFGAGVSPGRRGLVPVWCLFFHGNVGVAEVYVVKIVGSVELLRFSHAHVGG